MDETQNTQYGSYGTEKYDNKNKKPGLDQAGNTRKAQGPRPGTDGKLHDDSRIDAAREAMREKVGVGVATVAGAVEGFADTMKDTHLADRAKEAVEQVGKTTSQIAGAAKEEALHVRDAVAHKDKGLAGKHKKDAPKRKSDSLGSFDDDAGSSASQGI